MHIIYFCENTKHIYPSAEPQSETLTTTSHGRELLKPKGPIFCVAKLLFKRRKVTHSNRNLVSLSAESFKPPPPYLLQAELTITIRRQWCSEPIIRPLCAAHLAYIHQSRVIVSTSGASPHIIYPSNRTVPASNRSPS